MIKIKQTKFGLYNGNCLSACIASIIETHISNIPDFGSYGENWFYKLYEYCLENDIGLIYSSGDGPMDAFIANSYCILLYEVIGIKTESHAILGKCNRIEIDSGEWAWESEIIFDPNPCGVNIGKLLGILLLIPNIGGIK